MSGRPPPRPFEIDPTRVEVVAEPEPMLLAAVEAEPAEPPPKGNRWLKWLGVSGGIGVPWRVGGGKGRILQGFRRSFRRCQHGPAAHAEVRGRYSVP